MSQYHSSLLVPIKNKLLTCCQHSFCYLRACIFSSKNNKLTVQCGERRFSCRNEGFWQHLINDSRRRMHFETFFFPIGAIDKTAPFFPTYQVGKVFKYWAAHIYIPTAVWLLCFLPFRFTLGMQFWTRFSCCILAITAECQCYTTFSRLHNVTFCHIY